MSVWGSPNLTVMKCSRVPHLKSKESVEAHKDAVSLRNKVFPVREFKIKKVFASEFVREQSLF